MALMISLALSILLFQSFTGLIEAKKNRWTSLPDVWYMHDGWYHAWRFLQVLSVVVCIVVSHFMILSPFQFVGGIACSLLSGNALMNRILVKFSQQAGSFFDINRDAPTAESPTGKPSTFKFGPWTLEKYPPFFTGWTEWTTFIAGITGLWLVR
jgi:hypothetical protein